MGVTLPPVVGDVLRVAAPVLAGALAGPLAPLAATIAAGALDAWLGPAAKSAGATGPVPPAAIVQAVQDNVASPDFLAAVRQAEADLKSYEISSGLRFAELEQKDRADARSLARDSGMARAQFIAGMCLVGVALFMQFGIVVGIIMALTGALQVDPAAASLTIAAFGLLGTITGAFSAIATQVLGFYYGSSAGSADKSAQMSEAMRDMGQALGDAAKAAPVAPAPAPVVVVPPHPVPAPVPVQPAGPSRFIGLVEKLLDHEGGWADDPNDSGGCTNHGITLPTLRDWRQNPTLTCEDVRALTREDAKPIYFSRYFNALCCGDMPPGVDAVVFDFGVNAGVSRAAKTLQQVLAKRDPSLKVDGVIGPLTLAAMAKASPRAVIEEFHAARMDFYRSLGKSWDHFGKGWARRAEAVLADALAAVAR